MVEPTELDLADYLPYAAAAFRMVLFLLCVRAVRKDRGDKADKTEAVAAPPAPAVTPEPVEDHGDDPDRGGAGGRRLALSRPGRPFHGCGLAGVHIREVPGKHNSMVLEPNVRALAGRIVDVIPTVQAALGAKKQ